MKPTIIFCGLVVITLFSDVHAEGRCPDGYFPIGGGNAGWEGCAPMAPNAGAGGSQQAREPNWETRWGAIATADGAMGTSKGRDSRERAEQQAIANCQSQSAGKPCKVRLAYHNQCAALAWGDAGSLAAHSYLVSDAENLALNTCKRETSNCDLLYSACSYAERVD